MIVLNSQDMYSHTAPNEVKDKLLDVSQDLVVGQTAVDRLVNELKKKDEKESI
jgi:hypothetical protein